MTSCTAFTKTPNRFRKYLFPIPHPQCLQHFPGYSTQIHICSPQFFWLHHWTAISLYHNRVATLPCEILMPKRVLLFLFDSRCRSAVKSLFGRIPAGCAQQRLPNVVIGLGNSHKAAPINYRYNHYNVRGLSHKPVITVTYRLSVL